ncbi:MAG: hypothetical protein DRN81_01990 [Thermoproteota archaeon]|nr:MAG: hypothetical protein DRN81_01990 [Candidatus Korarchaeota archaeon]
MSLICEHEFMQEDPMNKGYSLTEYDLYASLGLAIRKNLRTGKFEIIRIRDKEVRYTGTLVQVVKIANRLEGAENTRIGCSSLCKEGDCMRKFVGRPPKSKVKRLTRTIKGVF